MDLRVTITRTPRLTRRDWLGDSVLTVLAGLALAASLALPWANVRLPGSNVSYALSKPPDINGALATPWGPPVAVIAAVVIALGLAMLALGTRRLAWLAGVLAPPSPGATPPASA